MGAGIVVLLRARRDMAWGAGCLICYGMGGYGLLWWAGPVSFVLPFIAFFLFFFLPSSSAVIFLLLNSMVSPHLTSAYVRVIKNHSSGEGICSALPNY